MGSHPCFGGGSTETFQFHIESPFKLDFVQNRPRPENFVCGDLALGRFKGKCDPSEIPLSRN